MRLLLVLVRDASRTGPAEMRSAPRAGGGMERARVVITDPPRAKMCRHQLCHKGPSMLEVIIRHDGRSRTMNRTQQNSGVP